MKKNIIGFLILLSCALASGETLWSPDFSGYLGDKGKIQPGDIVVVKIDSSSNLKLSASKVDSEKISLEISGGEAAGLLGFLPTGSSGEDQSLKAAQDFRLTTSVVTRIQEIDERGLALIQGSRQVALLGAEESLSLSGWIDTNSLDADNTIPFGMVADAKITYVTYLDSQKPVLTPQDLSSGTAETAPPTVAPGTPAAETVTAPASAPEQLTLTQEKKRQLLLFYLNRLLDLIFDANRL